MNVLYDFDDGKYMANFLFNDTLCKVVMVKGDPGEPTDAQVKSAVYEYLEEHPNTFNPEGEYEDFTAGNANQLTSNIYTEDTTPYIYRAVPEGAGNREIIEQITGGTVAWNQLVHNGNFADTTYWSKASNATFSVSNNIGTFKAAAQYQSLAAQNLGNMINGHVYLATANAQSYTSTNTFMFSRRVEGLSVVQSKRKTLTTTMTFYGIILKAEGDGYTQFLFQDNNSSDWGDIKIKQAMLHDLTNMFGSTIADYIYSLEQSTAGAGVSLFKSLFPKDYYPYNSGELMSVKTSARETVGFNQWDEEWEVGSINASTGINENDISAIRSKNYIPVMQGTEYYFTTPSDKGNPRVRYYDSEKRFLSAPTVYRNAVFTVPSGVMYMRFATQTTYGNIYNNDICINLSKTTGSPKNGDYVPYEHHTYPLSNIELRGIPKLENNKLTYDGDIYKADRSVTRRFGIVTIDENSSIGQHKANDTRFYIQNNDMKRRMNYLGYVICDRLQTVINHNSANENGFVSGFASATSYIGQNWIYFSNGEATTIADMKTWLASNPLTVVYELATPTTESTTPYTETQICSPYGTESFVDDRDVQIPVGHKTRYMQINDPADITVPNAGNVPSAPTIQLIGSGTVGVYLGNAQALQVSIPEDGITIDTEAQDATSNGQLANRSVTGDYDSVRLQPGDNDVSFSGDVSAVITNYTRWV